MTAPSTEDFRSQGPGKYNGADSYSKLLRPTDIPKCRDIYSIWFSFQSILLGYFGVFNFTYYTTYAISFDMDQGGEVVKSIAKVYVGGLTENVEKYHLEELFERFGLVKTVWIARNPLSRGYAFVTFFDPKHADEAVKGLNGTSLQGSKLKVQLSKNEIVKIENEHKDRDSDPRDHTHQRRHRSRDRNRYVDRKRGRSRDRDRSPMDRKYDEDPDTRDISSPTLDSVVIQESLMLREAVLRSGLSPFSFITNSLLQTAALPSLPLPCMKSPTFGATLNYMPYPHVVGDTFGDLRQHRDFSGPNIVLQTSRNAPPSVAYSTAMTGIRSPFLQASTPVATPQYQNRFNLTTSSMKPSEFTPGSCTSDPVPQMGACTSQGNEHVQHC